MSQTLRYEIVDVFTRTPFTGNPLAVVLGAETLSGAQMQALAREFHLSETAFPLPAGPQDSGADYRVRIFTPETELPFAGHPSIGTAWVLARAGRLRRGRVVQACGAGPVVLEVGDDGAELTGAAPWVGPVLDPDPILRAVGLVDTDLLGPAPRLAGTGLDFVYLAVRDDAVSRAVPDLAGLRALADRFDTAGRPVGGVMVFAVEPRPGGPAVHARVFAGEVGVPEDPATGSAALGLGAYLVGAGLSSEEGVTVYEVRQGAELARPSLLRGRVEARGGTPVRCHVAGDVVAVAAGEIRVPRG